MNPTIYGRYASMMRALGEGREGRDLLKRAVELDPLEATYWWQLGEVTEDADPSEGERIKKLALELDPSVDDNVIDFGGLENSDGGPGQAAGQARLQARRGSTSLLLAAPSSGSRTCSRT